MTRNEAVFELMRAANEIGIAATLFGAFGKNIKVNIPFGKTACDTSIDDLDFSVRASNSMKRVGVFTVGDVIDLISNDELLHVRNLGKKTQTEIKTRVLDFGYGMLSENDKRCFWFDVVEKNCK